MQNQQKDLTLFFFITFIRLIKMTDFKFTLKHQNLGKHIIEYSVWLSKNILISLIDMYRLDYGWN